MSNYYDTSRSNYFSYLVCIVYLYLSSFHLHTYTTFMCIDSESSE